MKLDLELFYLLFPLFPLRKRHGKKQSQSLSVKKPRMNERIRVTEVLLVEDDGTTHRLSTEKALEMAKEQELDLIEVSPKANPPVVKIGDFGQYLYQLQKQAKKQRAHTKQTEVKTLRFGFRTDTHDLQRLIDRSKGFLEERHLVKFILRMRGRELTNKEYAKEKLDKVVEALKDVADVEQEVKKQGNQFVVVFRAKR